MAISWLRLWHDMPNDPKWRTIARVSKQPISSVIAVYVHLLVIASNASERGRTLEANREDIASALDLDTEQVDAIFGAMEGRVLDDDRLKGWEKRQVEREDGSAARAKAWREAKKEEKQTQANASELKRTPDKDKDKDKDKDINIKEKEKEKPTRAKKFISPSKIETDEYALSEKIDLTGFFLHYESNGWLVGRNKMRNWQASARLWNLRQDKYNKKTEKHWTEDPNAWAEIHSA